MPDEAREVIFPEGVRIIDASETDIKQSKPAVVPPPIPEPVTTEAEGDLLTDAPIGANHTTPEDEDDLLGPA